MIESFELKKLCFVHPRKVTLLLNPFMDKPWYIELMTFLIALAMGTMFCVTIYQLIPESLELLHTLHYTIGWGPACKN